MNDNRITIWKWAVGLLVVCNLALLLTMWLRPGGAGPQAGPHGQTPRDMLISGVALNKQQVSSYDMLIARHREAMDSLQHTGMQCRRQLFASLAKDSAGSQATDSLLQVIANTQRAVELVTYRHFEQVRALCTAEQKIRFDRVINDVLSKMNGGMHGRPPGGEDPPREEMENERPR